MPFSNFTNLDFDQIKTSIKDYLRANSNFTDFDFDGSNFSVLIDTLAYNTYINSFNSNMIVNESFLDSATLRENVVSLASNIGYTPRSKTAANAQVTINLTITDDTSAVTLEPGIVCTGDVDNETYTFAITQPITTLTEIDPSDPTSGLKNFSFGMVSTILRTDLRIALSFLRIGKSFVTGWGENDKLMSLNAFETLLYAINQVLYLFIPFF